jgi:hypothetical protein
LTPVFFFDPFFGTFFSEVVPADIVLGDITRGGVGGNLGAGFDLPFAGQDFSPKQDISMPAPETFPREWLR